MSVISTYLNDNAQTLLNRFVVYMLYSQRCNKYSDKSNRWSLSVVLRFFDFSRWRPSWIVEFTKFHSLTVAGCPRRITSPNFIKIGRSIAEMLHFFVFSRWRPPPSWIVEFSKFGYRCLEDPHASFYQISSKSVVPFQIYIDFSNFQDGRRRHLGFLKSRNYTVSQKNVNDVAHYNFNAH